jgi:hypothetical protein
MSDQADQVQQRQRKERNSPSDQYRRRGQPKHRRPGGEVPQLRLTGTRTTISGDDILWIVLGAPPSEPHRRPRAVLDADIIYSRVRVLHHLLGRVAQAAREDSPFAKGTPDAVRVRRWPGAAQAKIQWRFARRHLCPR